MGAPNGAATACERIKHTPTPHRYDYFTRIAVAAFSTLLPFGLLGAHSLPPTLVGGPLTAVIAGAFIVLERIGAVLDTPFPNTVNDVPITAICRDIERDLHEQPGDHPLPTPCRTSTATCGEPSGHTEGQTQRCLDIVLEGDAMRVTDDQVLRQIAASYLSKYGNEWRFIVRDGGFTHAAEALREADTGIAVIYEVAPNTAFAFHKGRTYSQTRFRFSSE